MAVRLRSDLGGRRAENLLLALLVLSVEFGNLVPELLGAAKFLVPVKVFVEYQLGRHSKRNSSIPQAVVSAGAMHPLAQQSECLDESRGTVPVPDGRDVDPEAGGLGQGQDVGLLSVAGAGLVVAATLCLMVWHLLYNRPYSSISV